MADMSGTCFVLATGPSMSQELADKVKTYFDKGAQCVAVSNAYKLAPWATAMCAADDAWWDFHKPSFDGLKFCVRQIKGLTSLPGALTSNNSGMLGIQVARFLGAKKIILLGFDLHGSHYFGPHPTPLKNTTEKRFEVFQEQFLHEKAACLRAKVTVINCTPGSALRCFPIGEIEDFL